MALVERTDKHVIFDREPDRIMEINVYQPCPCHPEKKIKFCCGKEIVHELDQALVKYRAGQARAALEAIDRLIAKSGPRDCLLTTKSNLLYALEEFEQALEVNTVFLEGNPQHFLGLEQRATLLAMLGRGLEAASALQDALDHLPTAEIPLSFAGVFLDVAQELLRASHSLAAVAHAVFARELKDSRETSEAVSDIVVSIAARDVFRSQITTDIALPATDAPWFKKADNARRAFRRGQFRKAGLLAARGLEIDPQQPSLLYYNALSLASLGDERQVDAWRALAGASGLCELERCLAEVMAQSAMDASAPAENRKEVLYRFDDVERVCEELRSDPRLTELPQHLIGHDGPQFVFLYLDRPLPRLPDQTSSETWPIVCGRIDVFGRRTDREPALGVSGRADIWQDGLLERLETANGQPFVVTFEAEVDWLEPIDRSRELPEFLAIDIPGRQFKELCCQHLQRFLLSEWPDMPLYELDGQTPRQAAADPALRLRLLAWLWRAEVRNARFGAEWISGLIDEVRAELNVAPLAKASHHELLWSESHAVACSRFQLSTFPTLHLLPLLTRSSVFGLKMSLRAVCEELLTRDDLPDSVGRTDLLMFKAQAMDHQDQAAQLYAEAAELASTTGRDLNSVLVLWLDWTLHHGRFNESMELLRRILKEPVDHAVKSRLDQIFMKYGLLTENGEYMIPRASEEEQTGKSESQLWTPDQGQPAAAGSSGLWLPGS